MSRDLPSGFEAAITGQSVRVAFLFNLLFGESPVRLWTGRGDITYNSNIYFGNGWIQEWSGIQESKELSANNFNITISSITETALSLMLNSTRQNSIGEVYLAIMNESFSALETDPYMLFSGKFDYAEIRENPNNSVAILYYESELIELEKAREWKYTDMQQKAFYPGDRGLEFVDSVAEWSGFWGVPERPKRERKQKTVRKKRR